eukprot:TRINITY_DN66845_c2_g1_i1.p1 TRINITY_DN66845_c2_g1~~TRINITY_DN66845_c2_g1_i1.p1  ORF type:complete len:186 (-),score=19.24 TRINITY_DN66845_c2_g1_i1:377-934(-)
MIKVAALIVLSLVTLAQCNEFTVNFNNYASGACKSLVERNKEIARTFINCFDFPNFDANCWRNIFNPTRFRWETLPDENLPDNVPHSRDSAEEYIQVLEGFASVLPDLKTQEEANIRVASETTVVVYGYFAGNTPPPNSLRIAPRHTWVLEIDSSGLITSVQEIADYYYLDTLSKWVAENLQGGM